MTHKNNIKDLEKLSFKIEEMGGSEKLKVRKKSAKEEKQYIPQPTLVGREDGKTEIGLKEIIEESHNEPKKW